MQFTFFLAFGGELEKLQTEECTGQDNQLFYLDGDDRLMVQTELKQLMSSLRAKYYLYNV